MKQVLIVGASRGIGLEFVRQYRERKRTQNMREISPDYERKKIAGFAWEGVLVFVCILMIVSIYWIAGRTRKTYFYSYPDHILRTVQNLDPCEADGTCGYRRLMQSVEYGVPNPETDMTFCDKPRFEQGHVFLWMRLTDIGPCWSVDGFAVLKENGFAKLPPNCKPDYSQAKEAGHIVCEGGRAKF